MLDPTLIRRQMDDVAARLAGRGYQLDTTRLATLEEQRKAVQVRTQELQALRNTRSKEIGKLKAQGADTSAVMAEVAGFGEELKAKEAELSDLQAALDDILMGVPNLPHESVPIGRDENDNVEVRRWGEPPVFDFEPKDHSDLGPDLGLMDFELAGRLSGSRFVSLSGGLARLHRALAQFMLDLHTTQHGYREMYVPFMVNAETLTGTGPFTILAPNNAAFDKLEDGTVDDLLKPENQAKLTGLLTYHIIPGKVDAAALAKIIADGGGSAEIGTVSGGKLTARMDGEDIMLTDEAGGLSKITSVDVETSNGTIHVIDSVAMPAAE